jgi:hypothetical protein
MRISLIEVEGKRTIAVTRERERERNEEEESNRQIALSGTRGKWPSFSMSQGNHCISSDGPPTLRFLFLEMDSHRASSGAMTDTIHFPNP